MFSIIRHKVRVLSGLHKKEMEDVTNAILTDMIKSTESIHAIPILVYLPVESEIFERTAVTQYESYMFSICQLNGKAKCFSTRPYFAEQIAKGATFKLRGHWDAAGHRTVAEAIKRYLVNEGLIPMP